ncbi:MAG: glycosyltransferase family 2 protein [Planctomycetes bacterium]|nr:glycosyltransferase family 2 protein [Planctomycetota bacterium]
MGVVVIGRNEGRHLQECLDSVVGAGRLVVYVDSGSTDDSVAAARSRGVEVVELDMSTPFTAARARNAGVARLRELSPGAPFVQFVDGDCRVVAGWIEQAEALLRADPQLGAVFGQRHEIHPEASVFNLICDLEWNTPLGGDSAFGGDAMLRLSAFDAVHGFDPRVIASEDRELWLRLQAAGWPTRRVDARMTMHDARITRVRQWWKRSERTGHAYGQISSMHRGPIRDPHHENSQRRVIVWGIVLPLVLLAAAVPTKGLSLLGLLLYAVPVLRAIGHGRQRGWSGREARIYAVLCVLARFPEAVGVLRWHWRRLTGRAPTLIEYKGPEGRPAS